MGTRPGDGKFWMTKDQSFGWENIYICSEIMTIQWDFPLSLSSIEMHFELNSFQHRGHQYQNIN